MSGVMITTIGNFKPTVVAGGGGEVIITAQDKLI